MSAMAFTPSASPSSAASRVSAGAHIPTRPPHAEFYRALILEQAPRVLSLMDRETFSPTAGCCDRTYWAWKFVDYPGSRFQEALCVLGFLYATNLPDSPYHRNRRLLEWIDLGLRYWCSIQYGDGSFDEAYPYERSLAATAFTCFYVGEAMRFLGDDCPRRLPASASVRPCNAPASWLVRHDETHGFLSNHLAAAAAALLHIHADHRRPALPEAQPLLRRRRFWRASPPKAGTTNTAAPIPATRPTAASTWRAIAS